MPSGYGVYGQGGVDNDEWGPNGVQSQEPTPPEWDDQAKGPRTFGEVVPHWGLVGNLPPGPPDVLATVNGDPPPAQLYSADPGNGQPHVPWISVDSLANLYVYGTLIASGGGPTPDWVNVKTFGATGNGVMLLDATINNGSAALSSNSASFTKADVGKLIMVDGAGGTNVPLGTTISGFTDSHHVTLAATASASVSSATCYYGTDDAPAIQSAMNAAQKVNQSDGHFITGRAQAVFVPWGIYMLSVPLVPASGKSFVINGDSAVLVGPSSAILNFNLAPGEGTVDVSGLFFEGAGGHCIENLSIHGTARFHELNLVQRNVNYSVFWLDDPARADGHTSGFYQVMFDHITYWQGPGTRAIEMWHIVDAGGAEITDVTWQYINGPNPVGTTPNTMDNTQYQFYVTCTDSGGFSTNITWKNCLAASFYGGWVKLGNAKNVTIEECNFYNTYVESVSNDLITFIDDPTGGNPCHAITIRNISRNNALGSATPPPPYDISFAADCSGILVENCVGGWTFNGLLINNNGAAGAVYINNVISQSGYPIIANQAGDTRVINAGTDLMDTVSVLPSTQQASVNGLLAWNFDPMASATGGAVPIAQTIYAMRVDVYQQITVGHLWFNNISSGSGATASNNWIGLYNASGTQIAQAGIDVAGIASGTQKIAVTANGGQSLTLVPGTYYVFWLVNASGMPAPLKAQGNPTQIDLGTAGANLRVAVYATGATTLPAPATMSNLVSTNAEALWVGLAS